MFVRYESMNDSYLNKKNYCFCRDFSKKILGENARSFGMSDKFSAGLRHAPLILVLELGKSSLIKSGG